MSLVPKKRLLNLFKETKYDTLYLSGFLQWCNNLQLFFCRCPSKDFKKVHPMDDLKAKAGLAGVPQIRQSNLTETKTHGVIRQVVNQKFTTRKFLPK